MCATGIEELHRGHGEAWAVVSAMPCARSPAGESYAIHPSLLDACFQVLIGAVGGSLSESYLPVRISKIEIHAPCRDTKYFVYASTKNPTQGSFVGDIRLIGVTDAQEKVTVGGLMCSSIGKKGNGSDDTNFQEWNDGLYEHAWKPDFVHLIDRGLLQDAVSPSDAPWDDEPERVVLAYLRRFVTSFTTEKRERILPLYQRLYQWIEETVQATANLPAISAIPSQFFTDEEQQHLKDESLVAHRIGFHLEEILLGTIDPLSLLFRDDTVYRVYETGPTFHQANEILSRVLDLLAHKHGQLRVLEVGAGIVSSFPVCSPVSDWLFSPTTLAQVLAAQLHMHYRCLANGSRATLLRTSRLLSLKRPRSSSGLGQVA